MSGREKENYYLKRAYLVPAALQEVLGSSSSNLDCEEGCCDPFFPRGKGASKGQRLQRPQWLRGCRLARGCLPDFWHREGAPR